MRKILIANRGEIAVRIARTCRKMGIHSVGVYSEADDQALHVQACDEAHCLGASDPLESYLNIEKILHIAKTHSVDAIHPGYGFLSENAAFSEACEKEGIIFIGPPASAIRDLGTKHRAKALAHTLGIPAIPGYEGEDQSEKKLIQEAKKIGFPLLIKASAGGGGKGMRVVEREEDLLSALQYAKGEARRYFADTSLILETYIREVKHVEIQVMADKFGNVVHGFERDCSLQRRNQKIIEETPCSFLPETTRQKLTDSAIKLIQAAHYVGVGTVEFLLDLRSPGTFYFLETNTRLQVEHTITEETTGIDFVEWQILIHRGEILPLKQEEIKREGHAMECRVYAEDPRSDFAPTDGVVEIWEPGAVEGIRFDVGIKEGQKVPVFYDSLLLKIISFGKTRNLALQRMRKALRETKLIGVTTNIPFLAAVLEQKDLGTDYATSFIPQRRETLSHTANEEDVQASLVVSALSQLLMKRTEEPRLSFLPPVWRNVGDPLASAIFFVEGHERIVFYRPFSHRSFAFSFDKDMRESFTVRILEHVVHGDRLTLLVEIEQTMRRWSLVRREPFSSEHEATLFCFAKHFAGALTVLVPKRFPTSKRDKVQSAYLAPMPGKILQVFVSAGHKVEKGDPLLTWESMKMEQTLKASNAGKIASVFVRSGDIISAHATLIQMEDQV
ncbi:MAG: ATP-grasp domain-containing protein [Deltaproteobacteria bacterium]|nr:ATP-grasp domain-containing protein [Deltaproteobacteria bacterium]